MIATEAAAEGLNLQFCSLLINYDLPWNPQRIEQRIGRVHRYGQKQDVVIINFINKKNLADIRLYDNSGATPLTDEELDFLRLLRSCSVEGRQIVFKLLETYRSPALLKQTNAALAETR